MLTSLQGYTLENSTCTYLGCNATGRSTEGNCTYSPGVLAQTEITALISSDNLYPQYLETIDMMQITYGSNSSKQWLAYDDEYTWYLKKQYANNMCFGGTMAWSIDLNGGVGMYVTCLPLPLRACPI